MTALFDPLVWLRSKGAEALVAQDGNLELRFDQYTRRSDRERIKRVIARHYEGLLRLQLDVPAGERPRTVQQLIAAGRVRIVDGRYQLVGARPSA